MLGVTARILRRALAALHATQGRLAWRCGMTRFARHRFERALALGGSEFTAYVHLGRIALGDGDYAGYRREMSNARACDPDRFARLRIPTEGLEPRSSGSPFEETGQRATWRAVRPTGNAHNRPSIRSTELSTDALLDELQRRSIESTLFGVEDPCEIIRSGSDDFSSEAERNRFRRLPPIGAEEVADADLDDLMRRLGG
jgi:hypothetical protein